MSPKIAAKDKTVELRGEDLNPSILPGTISNTQGLPPDRGLPCSCAAQCPITPKHRPRYNSDEVVRGNQYYTVGRTNTDRAIIHACIQ